MKPTVCVFVTLSWMLVGCSDGESEEIKSILRDHEDVHREVAGNEARLEALEGDVDSIRGSIHRASNESEQEIDALRDRISELHNEIRERDRDIEELKTTMVRLELLLAEGDRGNPQGNNELSEQAVVANLNEVVDEFIRLVNQTEGLRTPSSGDNIERMLRFEHDPEIEVLRVNSVTSPYRGSVILVASYYFDGVKYTSLTPYYLLTFSYSGNSWEWISVQMKVGASSDWTDVHTQWERETVFPVIAEMD